MKYQKRLWYLRQATLLNLLLHGLMIFLFGYPRKLLVAARSLLMQLIVLLMISLPVVLQVMVPVLRMVFARTVPRVSVIQISKMIVQLRHNSRRSFHGFSVLCLLLIVQKVAMGLTPTVWNSTVFRGLPSMG